MGFIKDGIRFLNELMSGIKKPSLDKILIIMLIGAILYGLVTKFFLSLSYSLNSDMVVPGLMSMEIWKYQNFFLSGFYLPAHDTYLFTDLLAFHLIPQIITGYDPVTLKVVSYIIFVLLLGAISLLIYRVSRSQMSALIFAALAININPSAYGLFAVPDGHIATAFFCVILILLALAVNPVRSAVVVKPDNPEKGTVRLKQKPGKDTHQEIRNESQTRTWSTKLLTVLFPVLTFLVAFSDTLVILWFVLPYIVAYLVFYKPKTTRSDLGIIAQVIAVGAAYVLKMIFIQDYVVIYNQVRSVTDITSTLPLFFNYLSYLISPGSPVFQGSQLSMLGLIGIVLLVVVIGISIFAVRKIHDSNMNFLAAILLLSGGIMMVAFLFSSYAGDLNTSRYLIFIALAIFILVAMGYWGLKGKYQAIYVSLLLAILTIAVVGSYLALGSSDLRPNDLEYSLIEKLERHGITQGYGTYWSANILTYLSGEKVAIRPVGFIQSGVIANYWNSCDRWYTYQQPNTYMIADNASLDETERATMLVAMGSINATGPEPYGRYLIYGVGQSPPAPSSLIANST